MAEVFSGATQLHIMMEKYMVGDLCSECYSEFYRSQYFCKQLSWTFDLGIETCFFDGMDAYIKTWLQFAFPLYVWSLVFLIIISSEYSSSIAKVFGSNPVAVLATLFLLSYAKLLRTIIAALYPTYLDYISRWSAGCCMAIWWEHPLHSWQAHWPFSCSFANISGLIPSLHLPPNFGKVASSTKILLLDQQSQNNAISWCLPSAVQRSTSLLDWTGALPPLCSLSYVCFAFSCVCWSQS